MKHNSFAVEETKFGEADMVEHSIDTNNQDFPWRLPYALEKELEEELTKLTAAGCIEPLVLVHKKDGFLHVCVDYQKLNQGKIPDQ